MTDLYPEHVTPVIHLSDYAGQPDVHLACGGWTTPLWHQGELPEPPPEAAHWGEPLRGTSDMVLYTFVPAVATCPDCVEIGKEKP